MSNILLTRPLRVMAALLLTAFGLSSALGTGTARADDTWRTAPATNDYNTGSNWVGNMVPTGGATAIFGASNTTALTVSGNISPGAFEFNAGAPAYTFSVSPSTELQLTGAGIVNNSSNAPTIAANASTVKALGSATLGNANVILDNGAGLLLFGNASGGSAAVTGGTNSIIDIGGLSSAGTTFGSLAGTSGVVLLGTKQLTIGGNNASTTYSGNISGSSGSLVKVGTGTLTVDGTNSYGGGTTITGGTLRGTTLSLPGNILNNGALAFQGSNGTYAGNIFGSGNVTIAPDNGFITFSGMNSYTGGTTVARGGLRGTTSSIQGDVVNNAIVIIEQSADGTYAGRMTGSGLFVKGGTGTLTLSGSNSYTGSTVINGGTLQGDTTSLQGDMHINSGSSLSFLQTSDGTFSSQISNGGQLIKSGAGTLTLTAANDYTGGTLLNAGTLQGSTTSVQGNIVNNASVVFDQATTGLYRGNMSGSGNLTKNGIGEVTMLGINSYSGGTTVNAGSLLGTTSSLQGSIVNNATVGFVQQFDGAFSGTISGTGRLIKMGGGAVTLSNANSYSGGTTINGGYLAIAADNSLGTANGGLTLDGGAIRLNADVNLAATRPIVIGPGGGEIDTNGFTTTIAQGVSGVGGLSKGGTGTLILNGANTYSGGTFLSDGTLRLGPAGALAPSGELAVNGGIFDLNGHSQTIGALSGLGGSILLGTGTLTAGDLNSSNDLPLATAISGSGTFNYVGKGILTLMGANTYTGGTIVNAGGLRLGAGGSLASGSALTLTCGTFDLNGGTQTIGALTANGGEILLGSGTLTVGNASSTVVAAGISGSGRVVKQGGGTLTLAAANTYTGGTIVNAGVLRLGAGGSLASGGALTLTGGTFDLNGGVQTIGALTANGGQILLGSGTLTVGNASSTVAAVTISGSGSIVKQGSGTLTLTATNTYTGGTLVSGGTLQGNSSSLQGNIANNAAVVFVQTATGTYAGMMSGTGSLTLQGNGLLNLTGLNTYSGGTVVTGGTLQGTSSSLQGSIANNASVVFNQSSTGTYAGAMAGTGSLTLQGGGVLNLTGTNTYTGATNVNGSALVVNGSLASSVIMNGSSLLAGSGTIGGLTNNGGIVSPGNSIGTLTVTGNFVQNGGAFIVEATSAGQSDRLSVGGRATINGGTVQVVAQSGTYARNTNYTIVSAAGGVTGTFSGVTSNFAFLTPTLSYDANSIYLLLFQSSSAFASGAQTANQYAVGSALDQASASATGDFGTVLNALSTLNTAQGPAALNAISGQNYSGFSSAMVLTAQLFMNSFLLQAGSGNGRRTRVALAEACTVACDAAPSALWGAWGGALGGTGSFTGNANSASFTYNVGGFAAGLDRRLTPNLLAGVTIGYTTGMEWIGGFSGQGVSNTFQAGLYGSYADGPLYVDGVAAYAYSANQMWRNIVTPGLAPRTAQGLTGANQFYGQVEAGYRFDLSAGPDAFVTPFARLQAYTGTQNAFTETGAQSLNLNIAAQTTNSLRSVLGAQIGGAVDLGWREKLVGQLRIGWSHEFADTARPVSATFTGAPTVPFTTYGVSPQRDGVVIGVSLNTAIAESALIYLRYEGDISGQDNTHALSAGLRMTW